MCGDPTILAPGVGTLLITGNPEPGSTPGVAERLQTRTATSFKAKTSTSPHDARSFAPHEASPAMLLPCSNAGALVSVSVGLIGFRHANACGGGVAGQTLEVAKHRRVVQQLRRGDAIVDTHPRAHSQEG